MNSLKKRGRNGAALAGALNGQQMTIGNAVDRRTTRAPGYAMSQKVRRRIEEIFAWFKTVGGLRRTRYRGLERVEFAAYVVGAAYNLVRLARLAEIATGA